jgi:hypothetical protein
MTTMKEDSHRAFNAAKAIVDGRDLSADGSMILVTLEHAVATILLAVMGDPRKAVGLLNEGLVPGIEERIAFYAANRGGRANG